MLGERIVELRKSKGLSQEELADILSTSRQAVSKWERGESDPDIDRLKDLAVYFNVSIDYLLGYDVETISVNNFIKRVKECCNNGHYDISIDEIKMIVSRNSNNFNLILVAIDYLSDYYYMNHDIEIVDLLNQYAKRAILLFQPDNLYGINLNSLHHLVASSYALKGEYELAKQYAKENQVIKSEELLAQCEFELGHYNEVEKITSDIFLNSISLLIDGNATQVRVFLRTNRIKEALDLCDWTINFTKSIEKEEQIFLNIVFIFSFIKTCCEKSLGLDYINSLNFLKENSNKTAGFKNVNDGIKFYSSKHIILASKTGDIKNDLLNEINGLKNNNVSAYQNALDIFNKVYGE